MRGRWWRARMLLLMALRAGVGGDERQLLALPGPSAGGVLRLHSDAAASKTATRTNSLRALERRVAERLRSARPGELDAV